MSDRELLELAAKAADGGLWNPLTDDGDALRLAVKLRLLVSICPFHTSVRWYDEVKSETHEIEQWDNGMTPEEWTRRAIVRAAAEIARSMQ